MFEKKKRNKNRTSHCQTRISRERERERKRVSCRFLDFLHLRLPLFFPLFLSFRHRRLSSSSLEMKSYLSRTAVTSFQQECPSSMMFPSSFSVSLSMTSFLLIPLHCICQIQNNGSNARQQNYSFNKDASLSCKSFLFDTPD